MINVETGQIGHFNYHKFLKRGADKVIKRYGEIEPRLFYVFEDRRLNYLEISKVACSSILATIGKSYGISARGDYLFADPRWNKRRGNLEDADKSHATFAFVRNPFDRIVSCYRDKIIHHQPWRTFYDASGYFFDLPANMSFAEFVQRISAIPDRLADRHFKSLASIVYENGNLLVDRLGRFENLDEDWMTLAREYHFDPVLVHRNDSKIKQGVFDDYRAYYNEKLVELVYQRYKLDVELLGYRQAYEELLDYVRAGNHKNRPIHAGSEGLSNRHAELQLLVNCLHAEVDQPAAAKMRDLAEREINWRALLRLADDHKVSPLLHQALKAHCSDLVPKAVLYALQQSHLENSRRNFFMVGELFRILALLQAHGISGIPYKGPVLAMQAYGDLAAREFGDLDIMVHERDHVQARGLLMAHGYELHLSKAQQLLKHLHHYHYELIRADNGTRVEIHWKFTESFWPFRFEPLRLWERLQPVTLAGKQVESFHPEDLLLILCAHAAKHLWQKLVWISDIAHLIQAHSEMKWKRILVQAEAIGCRRLLFVNLLLAKNLLGAKLPAEILQCIAAETAATKLAAQVQKHLLADKPSPWQRSEMLALYFKMRECWRDRLPLIFFDLNTPSRDDRKNLLVPPALSFLYFVLRPLRLILKSLRNPLGGYRMVKG